MKGYKMEYARLTDGNTTIIVVDQDQADRAPWPFTIKIKTGAERFKHFDSCVTLGSAMKAAMGEFQSIARHSANWE
jgi:hypothetical protein